MNRQIRALGAFLLLCYVVVFVQLNLVQVFRADELNDHPENSRVIKREYNRPRGAITSADGALLAESRSVDEGLFERVRVYPEKDLFAQVTGYYSFLYGATGVERTYDAQLTGSTFNQQLRGFADLFVNRTTIGNVALTVRRDLQQTARDALGNRAGSAVVLDPRTGAVLALYSNPSFDPNALTVPDLDAERAAWDVLQAAPGNPLLGHAYQERYFPGSTFKVVTAGNGLQSGTVSRDQPSYPAARAYQPTISGRPVGPPIANFGGEVCGGTLEPILETSCNSAFAEMGTETIGARGMVDGSQAFGFNSAPPIDLPGAAASAFPTEFARDPGRLAQASIGQNDVQATALQMACVAAAVANGGVMQRPHVLDRVTDSEGRVVEQFAPEAWLTPLSPEHAQTLREAMRAVVTSGTGVAARVPGYEVGGKTGTAQLGDGRVHTWMIAFAGPPGGAPEVAVSVVVLNQPSSNEFTGGQVAGPIARQLMANALAVSRPR